MLLHRIHLNPRCKEARRDLADPYQMHATLCRAFYRQETPCPPGELLWRLEPETDATGNPRVLVQSREAADWSRLATSGWIARADPSVDLVQKLALDTLESGRTYRFRLRANPCKTVQGKRQGLMQLSAQLAWLERKGEQHGYLLQECSIPDYFAVQDSASDQSKADVRVSHEQMLSGHQKGGNAIRVYAVLFEGRLAVRDPQLFRAALESGIGHGKVMGLGLLSIVPVAT
jgi:CRISPR system Cascade subunit CasE